MAPRPDGAPPSGPTQRRRPPDPTVTWPDPAGNTLARALEAINRDDIVSSCITESVMVTDAMEAAMAKARLDQSGFDSLREELGPSRDTSFRPDLTFDDRDIMKEAESVEDVRAAEVQKPQPVTPPADVDESKYAAEEKAVTVRPAPRAITPKDGPATGQVTVADLSSPSEEQQIAPVRLPEPETETAESAEEQKRRSLVLRELGDALAEVERTQPPLSKPARHTTDTSIVEEPAVVSEKKGLKSPVTPAFIVPTEAVKTETAPGDLVSRAPTTPPPSPTESDSRPADGSKTTVEQQTSERVTDDGTIVQKSTTITTTTIGDGSEVSARLASEGILQKSEAAPIEEVKEDAPKGSNGGAEPPQSSEVLSELLREGAPGQGPTLRRMVRTETRTMTTLDDSGQPVTRTVTERITTEADGTETRQVIESQD